MTENRISARDLLLEQTVVLPTLDITLPNPLLYSNSNRFCDLPFQTWLLRGNISRQLTQSNVIIGKYQEKAYLDTGTSYSLEVGGYLVKEQLAPWTEIDFRGTSHDDPRRIVRSIGDPCLLASRYGETTWGHWLIEILPKIVIAEMVFPNRFKYVVPGTILQTSKQRNYASSVMESITAYGISMDRIVEVKFPQLVEFTELYDVTGVFSDGIHPLVLKIMQDRVDVHDSFPQVKAFATLRKPTEKRSVVNQKDVIDVIRATGLSSFVDFNRMTFREQVALFRNANWVVADLGSNLAGIIYSHNQVNVLSMSPNGWRDGYFVNIFQRLDVRQADVRGASTFSEKRDISHSTHVINSTDLGEAFQALADRREDYEKVGRIVAGRSVLRNVPKNLKLITFGQKGNARSYQKDGWADAEDNHTWSLGNSCSLSIDIPPFAYPGLWLEMRGIACLQQDHLPSKLVEIFVNGFFVHSFSTENTFHERFPLPKQVSSSGDRINILIRHPVAPSPFDLGLSSDTRPLGIGFVEIAIQVPKL